VLSSVLANNTREEEEEEEAVIFFTVNTGKKTMSSQSIQV
jgi:hypothetical protein